MTHLIHGNCLEVMGQIPDKSIDMIFTDLPYGTTQNHFDKPIPLEDYIEIDGKYLRREQYLLLAYRTGIPYRTALATFRTQKVPGLWSHYKRIIKDNGCIALFAQAPYDVDLIESGKDLYRYEWIIQKTRPTGHLNARKAPLKAHEKILIFYKKPPVYNPQMTEGHPPAHTWSKAENGKTNYKQTHAYSGGGSTQRFPTDVLTFKWDTRQDATHPNQKPVAVCEYFIQTYTAPGGRVLDSCMGSCSAGVACINTNREFIGIEIQENIFIDATLRIEAANKQKKEGVHTDVEEHQNVIQSRIEGF